MILATYLERHSLSADSFARKVGVSASAISRYRNGSRVPHPKIMHRIVEATGGAVSPQDFFDQYSDDAAPMPHISWHRHDNLLLHITVLQALVLGTYAAMRRRDPELARGIAEEGLGHIKNLTAEDKEMVRKIIGGLL